MYPYLELLQPCPALPFVTALLPELPLAYLRQVALVTVLCTINLQFNTVGR